MSFIVRAFSGVPFPAFAKVIEESIRELCFVDHGGDEATIRAWLNGAIDALFVAEHVVIASDDYVFLGVAGMRSCSPVGELTVNYVSPAGVGFGVGTAMLTELERWARERCGVTQMKLISTAGARHFYRKHGYDEIEHPWRGNGVSWNHPMRKVF